MSSDRDSRITPAFTSKTTPVASPFDEIPGSEIFVDAVLANGYLSVVKKEIQSSSKEVSFSRALINLKNPDSIIYLPEEKGSLSTLTVIPNTNRMLCKQELSTNLSLLQIDESNNSIEKAKEVTNTYMRNVISFSTDGSKFTATANYHTDVLLEYDNESKGYKETQLGGGRFTAGVFDPRNNKLISIMYGADPVVLGVCEQPSQPVHAAKETITAELSLSGASVIKQSKNLLVVARYEHSLNQGLSVYDIGAEPLHCANLCKLSVSADELFNQIEFLPGGRIVFFDENNHLVVVDPYNPSIRATLATDVTRETKISVTGDSVVVFTPDHSSVANTLGNITVIPSVEAKLMEKIKNDVHESLTGSDPSVQVNELSHLIAEYVTSNVPLRVKSEKTVDNTTSDVTPPAELKKADMNDEALKLLTGVRMGHATYSVEGIQFLVENDILDIPTRINFLTNMQLCLKSPELSALTNPEEITTLSQLATEVEIALAKLMPPTAHVSTSSASFFSSQKTPDNVSDPVSENAIKKEHKH